MSAYILDVEQIALLAIEAQSLYSFTNPITKSFIEHTTPADVAELLIRQNIRSVEARYPQYGEAGGLLNCPAEEYVQKCISTAEKIRTYDTPYHELVALCDTYDYQSCETTDYHSTNAFWFVNQVRKRAARGMSDQIKLRSAA